MTSNGQPDQARSARYVLKDYVNGKLLHCYAPPTSKQDEYHVHPDRIRINAENRVVPPREQRALKLPTSGVSSSDLDDQFFQHQNKNAYIKGRSNFPHIRQFDNNSKAGGSQSGSTININSIHNLEKPWRQKTHEKKKEKLRRKYVHLDQH